MGLIGEFEVDGSDDLDEDVEDIDDGESENDKVQVAITSNSLFLAVRALVFDPNAAKGNDFSPCIVAAVFSNLTRTPNRKKAKQHGEVQSSFKLKRAVLKRLTKRCAPSLAAGSQISCRSTGAQLGATVVSVVSKPLASFDSEAAVNEFVAKLVEMVESA